MNTAFIFLAQAKGAAALEILLLLIISATIGYTTAWIFYKSVYKKRLKEIQSDKHHLNNRIINLNGTAVDLQIRIDEKDRELERYFLEDLAHRNHLIDYHRIGKASREEKDDLTMISGIGPVIERRLNYLGIYTIQQISRLTPQDIEVIDNTIVYFTGRIERDEWVAQAIELVQIEKDRITLLQRISERKDRIPYDRLGTATPEEADDLTLICGIGGWIRTKLNILDIYTFRQISNFTQDDITIVTEAIEYFPGRIERDDWIYQASEFVRIAGDKASLLNRIRERREIISYDRIGIAHTYRANNLTLINGIGSWVEERLNAIDIHTFGQVSRMTHADIKMISEILEIVPGQIEKDNWVGQAIELTKKAALKKNNLTVPGISIKAEKPA